MRRFGRLIISMGVVSLLSVSAASAQLLNELLRSAVNEIPTDMFGCGNGFVPCNLSTRYFSSIEPSEINGPANPTDGIPSYRSKAFRYLSDVQTTANFPLASIQGQGNDWYSLWDGVTDPTSTSHAGWYGAQGQVVLYGEIGNSLSFNCLPVASQEACFHALDPRNGFNDTQRANGTPLLHVGGISPIPCPRLTGNGVDSLTFTWEQAANFTVDQFADPPLTGYSLYLLGDPLATDGTEAHLAARAVQVATTTAAQTSATISRSALRTGSLARDSVYLAALKMRYRGGLESLYFSCNSAPTGQILVREPGDANAAVDVEALLAERRTLTTPSGSSEFLYVSMQLNSAPVDQANMLYGLDFYVNADSTVDFSVLVFAGFSFLAQRGTPILFISNGLTKASVSVDSANGLLSFIFDPEELASVLAAKVGTPVTGPVNVSAGLGLRSRKNFYILDSVPRTANTFIGTALP